MSPITRRGTPLVRLALLGIAFGIALLSCGRDVTGPGAVARYARGISWRAEFPPAMQVAGVAAAGVADFNRVRVLLLHSDGTVALDTIIDFPAGADSVPVTLAVKLLPSAPTSGEPMSLNLSYINAAGDTLFKGGPVGVTATTGDTPTAAVTVPVTYTGPGAGAVAVQITPRSASAVSGNSFTFTAVAVDHNGVAVPNTPIVWNSLDPTIASIPSAASGTAQAGFVRGTARIQAQLLTGPTDQVTLNVVLPPAAIAAQSGSGQSGLVGATLASPLVAVVTASDGVGAGGVAVTFTVTGGGGSVGNTTVLTNDAGVAQTTWRLGSTIGTQTVTASASGLNGSPVTYTATARSPVATRLAVTSQPSSTTAGATISPVTIVAQTATGDTATAFNGPVTLALSGGTSSAVLGGTTTVNAVGGVATFTNLTVNKSGSAYALVASAGGLTGVTTSTFNIAAAAPSKLAFTAQPSSSSAGVSLGNVTVTATDAFDNIASGFSGVVTMALAANPGSSTLGGTTSVNAVAGVATFGSLTLNHVGTGYALTASATGFTSAQSGAFNITPGAAASILLTSGAGQTAGINTALPVPISVQVQDASGNGVPGTNVTFAVTVGGGSLTVTSGATDGSGTLATFWTLGATSGTQTVTATATGLLNSPLTINATATSTSPHLVFSTSPAVSQISMTALTPNVVVQARDATNALMAGFTGPVAIAIGTNAGGGTLGGTVSVNAVGGVATFSTLTIDKAGIGYTLGASTSGFSSAVSTAFNIAAGAAAAMAKSAGDGQSAAPGAVLPTALAVLVTDASGNPVAGRTINWAVLTGGGSVASSTSTSNASGVATIVWTLGSTAGAQTVSASSTGLAGTPLTFTATATTGAATQIAINAGNAQSATAGAAVTTPPSVIVKDASSNPVIGVSVTFAVATGGGSVTGASATTNASGIATVGSWTLGTTAGSNTLTATSAGLAGSPLTFTATGTAGPATQIAINAGNGQSATAGTAVATPPSAIVKDANNNPVSGIGVTFAIASGGGSITGGSATTNASGVATIGSWTLGATVGSNTLSATSTGLTGSPLTFNATGTASAGIASTTVAPHTFTLTAIGAATTLVAQAKDGAGGNVAGTFTWVSRNPAVATVGTTGIVTAQTNGTAYVVATETGGTKDSALVTVAQQLATISVTPGNRNMHIGDVLTFTASAVDGLGHPLAAQPSFTWASNAPSVASVGSGTGVVTAITLGNGVQIQATSGSVTGVSTVNVITKITRIVVAVDSGGSTTTDVATLPSLLIHRTYVAIPYDSANNVLSGITFNWVSTNASVAGIDSAGTASTKARVKTAANGTTSIQATAQGFTSSPGATLTVSQVLASISLTPASATIAVSGSQPLVAHGLDANGQTIGTTIAFTYSSTAPGVATINSSGVVTGVALGSANMTAVSGAITSNNAVITVANTGVPAVISFGRDTLSVGRGSSTSIPIFLSKPNATAVTINLAVADTFAFWSTASVSIPANATSVNATLNGHNAGTTTVSATDGSGQGYAPASAVLAVQATLRLTSGGYAMNGTDQVTTQVLMSDPSPAGGTYVTFNFSVPGKVSVSPNPAFIPAGQLAADIQINGVAAGSTNITPAAIGVNGTASGVTVYAPVITTTASTQRLGAGQFESGNYLYVPTYNSLAIPITLTSSDTTIATVTPSITIPSGNNYAYYTISAKSPGTATVTFSSPGWTASSSISVISTTPHLSVGSCCGTNLNTTSPVQNVYVYSEDSVGSTHYRTSSLVVRLTSSDTTVLKVLDTIVTIAPGQYYNSSGRVIPNGAGGSAYLIATASGHTADSTHYTVVGPKLEFSWSGSQRIGLGQEDVNNNYIYAPNAVATPLVITLTTDTTKVGVPSTVTIPAGQNYVYFTVLGNGLGANVPIIASAAGYQGDTSSYTVTTPRLTHSGGGTLRNFEPPQSYYVYSTDSIGNGHTRISPLTITLKSTDTTIIKTDTIATIAAGQYYTTTPPNVTPVGLGTAKIIVTAPGQLPDTISYTVVQPTLGLSFFSTLIGKGQNFGGNPFYVYTPDNRATPLTVTLTQKHSNVDSLSASTVSITTAQNYQYFGMFAITQGTDTVIASAPGYLPDTAYFIVSSPKLTTGGLPGSATTTNPPITVTVYATDSLGNGHYVNADVVVKALTSDSTVLRPTQQYFHIPAGQYYAQPTFNVVGPGTASITFSDSAGSGYSPATTNTITITGPSLTISNGVSVIGMRQNTGPNGWYVYTPNNVATPLTVNLASSSTRVATVPASVTIPAGNNYAYFGVTGQDTLGTIQVTATATGYNASSSNIQVTAPKFIVSTSTTLNTTSQAQTLTIYAADANGNTHYTNENVTVGLASSAPGVATIDSAGSGVTIVAGNYYTQAASWKPVAVGTAQLSMTDGRAVFYKYNTATVNIAVVTPTLNFGFANTSLGIGQYIDNEYVYTPDYMTSSVAVSFSHLGTSHASTLVSGSPVSSVTISSGSNIGYFRLLGVSAGIDSLVGTLSSPFHNPATTATTVGLGRIDPISGWPGSINAGDSVQVTLYARDPAQNARNVQAATVFTLAPNSHIQFVSGGVSSTVITSATIPADGYYVQFYLKGVSSGTGSATITSANYVTYTNTVTVP